MGLGLGRPKIPAGIQRQILTESGHRCAVCGEPLPLDRAHIIPWRQSKEHKVEDLVCLCANCHRRADVEDWGQRVLREYKKRPWVLRRFEANPVSSSARLRLSVDVLDGAAEINGGGQCDGIRHSNWQVWLEIYLAPSDRLAASIPIHRITGSLEISGCSSQGFESVSLETEWESPPDALWILYGRRNKPKQLVVTQPTSAILVAFCQTPEWTPSREAHEDYVRFGLDVAEADYEAIEIVAPLAHLEYAGSTRWRLRSRC
jgi:HNH endonuclease